MLNNNKKTFKYISIVGLSLAGILAPFPEIDSISGQGRQLQEVVPPPTGMTKAESGLSDEELISHLTVSWTPGCEWENNCNQCEGNCENDDDCYGILKCQIREHYFYPVPGCEDNFGSRGRTGNVCYLPDGEFYPKSPPLPKSLLTKSMYVSSCSATEPCDQCEGLCEMGEDEQCAGDLRCSSLRNGVWPTGSKNCNQDGMSDSHWTGYCMPEEDYVPLPTSNISDDWEPESVVPYHGELIIIPECPPEGCPVCSAPMNDGKGCTDDDVCAEGLSCYNRHGETDAGHKQVAGCQGSKVSSYGYCYTKDLAYELPEIPYRTQPPPNNEFVLTNEVQAPEECSIYAVDRDKTIDVPFSGSSEVGVNNALFHKVSYTFIADATYTASKVPTDARCGDQNGDGLLNTVLDCEILAIATSNKAINTAGNVDNVSLLQLGAGQAYGGYELRLSEPWIRTRPQYRETTFTWVTRRMDVLQFGTYSGSIRLACELIRTYEKEHKVVIFFSDGVPYADLSNKETIMNDCDGAIFHTFALTEQMHCDKKEENPFKPHYIVNSLNEIAGFSGGTCTEVDDVGLLPKLLEQFEKTTFDGVAVTVNSIETKADVSYSSAVPLEAPNSVTFSGSVPLGPGEHKVCFAAKSSTSGVMDKKETCKTIVVEAIEADPQEQVVAHGLDATFTVRFLGTTPGCDTFADKDITVELCDDEGVQVLQTKTGADGSVVVTVPSTHHGSSGACYKACHTAANGSKSCATTKVDYDDPSRTTAPTEEATTQPPINDGGGGGVNGDPLIMGLSGQLFKFNGRSGAWYSAVSTRSFQWNLRINQYDTCPEDSNTFVSGAGFAFFKNGQISKNIEVSVVNPYNVDVGCGSTESKNCLGAGSLELVIDGVKHLVGGDYKTKDSTARITAFNTFYQCSRKWYDFDVRPKEQPLDSSSSSLRSSSSSRGLATTTLMGPPVFDIISGLKKTMIDPQECQEWINDRQRYGDLFMQPGHYSTVIIQTEDITLHLEYKQESERCNAHSIDVWISSISPGLLEENWEGVIGETKDNSYGHNGGDSVMVDRTEALKHSEDSAYEVQSPFSGKCKGCIHR